VVKNTLVELGILGQGKIQGDIENIRPVGDITLVPGQSKFMFQSNDFIITKGLIRFINNERSSKINPSLLIVGQANVAQHNVTVEVKGDMEHPLSELRSQPALSQADILSLLTIGITSNQANNMDEKERQLATSVGIGSIFANQLRLGKELNNMFGIKLSVTPELSQDSVNYADAISSTGNAIKLKNSTKIKLRKQIADDVELSFSSTVGGTSEQIQKINVNYNLNDNISLEGLYETRESTIENRLTQPESLGVDLKMIMEFE
jgi:translocation and assembly module TamB